MRTAAWMLAFSLAATACNEPLGYGPIRVDVPTLEVTAPTRTNAAVGWKGERLEIFSAVSEPRGLAGIEVMLSGDAGQRRYVAADIPVEPFEVPEEGQVRFVVVLHQDGRVIAEGGGSWSLRPKTAWEIEFNRAPYPRGGMVYPDRTNPNPPCGDGRCHTIWRFAIMEDARNYPDEALFVTLWRVVDGECADVC